MKRFTLILIITGGVCTVIGVVCIIAAAVKLSDLGFDFARNNYEGNHFSWTMDKDNWDENGNASGDKVNVHLPFMDIVVDGDNVDVNFPGLDVNVDDQTGDVHVSFGDETDPTDAANATDTMDSSAATETTAK